mmetsp:Transcript_20188/g.47172  ORF Transcript_20188/g.47172 Transcript_20188/m.47172 type:complete len:268 (+) Transcript_20188:1957-2760(+)
MQLLHLPSVLCLLGLELGALLPQIHQLLLPLAVGGLHVLDLIPQPLDLGPPPVLDGVGLAGLLGQHSQLRRVHLCEDAHLALQLRDTGGNLLAPPRDLQLVALQVRRLLDQRLFRRFLHFDLFLELGDECGGGGLLLPEARELRLELLQLLGQRRLVLGRPRHLLPKRLHLGKQGGNASESLLLLDCEVEDLLLHLCHPAEARADLRPDLVPLCLEDVNRASDTGPLAPRALELVADLHDSTLGVLALKLERLQLSQECSASAIVPR